jgi:hypothetical protein
MSSSTNTLPFSVEAQADVGEISTLPHIDVKTLFSWVVPGLLIPWIIAQQTYDPIISHSEAYSGPRVARLWTSRSSAEHHYISVDPKAHCNLK